MKTEAFRLRSATGVVRRHLVCQAKAWKVALTWFLIEPAFVLVAMGAGVGRLVDEIPGRASIPAGALEQADRMRESRCRSGGIRPVD